MATVKVLGSPTSAEVARVLACLFEKEVQFQLIRVDIYRGRKRLPEYLKLLLKGQALAFEDGKKTMVDSRNMCRHLAETYVEQGNPDLLGSGTLERAAIEQWLRTEAQSFDEPSSKLVFNLAVAQLFEQEQDEVAWIWLGDGKYSMAPPLEVDVIRQSKKDLGKVLDIYDRRLDQSRYLAGDKFTLADLSHLPNAQRLVNDDECLPLFKSRKRLYRWWEEISSRPSWRRVVELQQEPPHDI